MQLGPKMAIVEALQVVDRWRFAHIAAVLNGLPNIAAYEILDEFGNGAVIRKYPAAKAAHMEYWLDRYTYRPWWKCFWK